MIDGMNDEGWEGGPVFPGKMWKEMEGITDFRAQGTPISQRQISGERYEQ
jgi:hypothetical protein